MKAPAAMMSELVRIIKLLDSPITSGGLLVLLLMVESLDPVMTAFALKYLLDGLWAADAAFVWRGAWLLLVVTVLNAVIGAIGVAKRVSLVEILAHRQREILIESGIRAPLLAFGSMHRGDLVSRLTSDIAVSSRALTECFLLARAALRAVAAAAYMLSLNWPVALACALTGPFTLMVSGMISRPILGLSGLVQKVTGEVSSEALNALEGAAVVKSYCAEEMAERRFDNKVLALRRVAMRISAIFAANASWTGTGSILPFLVAFGYGGYMVVQGRLTIGGVLALINLCNNLGWPLAGMGQSLANVRKSLGAFERVAQIWDVPRDVDPVQVSGKQSDSARQTEPVCDEITVRNLSFEYVEGRPVLRDVSISAPQGSLVVLAGRSGCGKSTLIKILAGLYRPPPGTVFIGRRDLHSEAVAWARKVVAYVPQEPFLFSGTLRQNLELAKPGATEAEIWEALYVADAVELVGRTQLGLDCDVSEKGSSFSGGERQRLSIARTLLKGGSILLVDEPTSSVDRESEQRIWSSLLKAMRGRTCIVATHRLDVARNADIIFVMDVGRIVERGTHETLSRQGSVYRSLVGEKVTR